MVLPPETGANAHPFWYARVLGVFHAHVFHVGPAAQNRSKQYMEFLWVRWFGTVPGYRYGLNVARLPKIGFVDGMDESAFGFLVANSIARPVGETDDWAAFYVMIYINIVVCSDAYSY
jgi:hypothetical protein